MPLAPQTYRGQAQPGAGARFPLRHQIGPCTRAPANAKDRCLDLRARNAANVADTDSMCTMANWHRLDSLHARRLENMEAVTLYHQHGGNHALVKDLRDTGVLLPALRKALLLD